MCGLEDSTELLTVGIPDAVVGVLPFFVALDVNLLGLLRRDFAAAFCFSSLPLLVAVLLLELSGVLSLEPLDDTPGLELLIG
jgi:putative effector of murein hydrolase LrgA (UPF0299 family)